MTYYLSKSDINVNFWTLNQKMSDNDHQIFIHIFPVLYHNNYPVLYAEFVYHKSEKIIFINVRDNNGVTYAPFTDKQYGNYKYIISKILKNINNEIRKLGIEDGCYYNI